MDISELVKSVEAEIIAFRRALHSQPELSNCEYHTTELVAAQLTQLGLKVETFEGTTGVIGTLAGEQPGKTIALRADMDALPLQEATNLPFASTITGVAHACGHDIHSSVLLGCAKVLSTQRSQIRGNVKFIFQPAEEGLAGAKKMLAAGALLAPAVDAIVALHCWPELLAGSVGIKQGAVMASSDTLDVTIHGQAGHAAHPHKSIDPIVISGQVLSSLQTLISREIAPVDSAVITIGKISGGTARNIIAANVVMEGTVRTISPELRQKMPQMLERMITKTAESMNGTAEVHYTYGTPPLVNDSKLLAVAEKTSMAVLGQEHVHYLVQPSMGSEDFAFYLEKVPGILLRLGTANDQPESKLALHNPKLIFDEKSIPTGIKVLSQLAIDYLAQEGKGE